MVKKTGQKWKKIIGAFTVFNALMKLKVGEEVTFEDPKKRQKAFKRLK